MKTISFKHPKFIKSALHEKDYPVLRDPEGKLMSEIAVAGRSNVGKSSLLNSLFQSRGLVKTSATPGKTQMLNFFTLDDRLAFVDLPGYGYANVPLQVRKQWAPMVQNYLNKRPTLKLVLFLFDIRRTPNDEDRQMITWASQADKALILVLTKVDKIGANEKRNSTHKILQAFGFENLHYVHFSAVKHVGHRELITLLKDVLKQG